MKAPTAERYDVIKRNRHIGKFGKRCEVDKASKRVIYTLYYDPPFRRQIGIIKARIG
jgi:hypothetical protein